MQMELKRHFRIAAHLCIALLIALSVASCVTLKEIKHTVEDTNRAMLPGNDLPDSAAGTRTVEPWEEPSARIDAFIAKNPDDKVTASTMRVRQAMLLLSYRKYNLSRAAFEQANDADLKRDRDIALKKLDKSLIWWFSLDKDNPTADDIVSEPKHVEALTAQIERLCGKQENQEIKQCKQENQEIQQYLEEMRAWIEIWRTTKAAADLPKAEYIGRAMDHYAETLTDKDIEAINEGRPKPGSEPPDPLGMDVRRQIRAMTVIEKAKSIVANLKSKGYSVNYQSSKAKQIKAINP